MAAVQFVNILDFVMVMPMGPDFADALNIATSDIGLLGGSYTAAAAVSGIGGSFFLDRFDRRKALAYAVLGLVIGTALGGFATGLVSLLCARVLAGAFGGPATSLALAIVTDAVPQERRGVALGTVMMTFSVASVLGVPLGLEISRLWGWQAPFFAVASMGLVLAGAAIAYLPPMRAHLTKQSVVDEAPLFDSRSVLSLASIGFVMLGVFAVVPSLSPYVQHNLNYPRSQIGFLYFVGGVLSFVSMRIIGHLVDRIGASKMVWIGTIIHLFVLLTTFIVPGLRIPILVFFSLYMLSGSARMVPLQTLATRVPAPSRRARYMSAQSAVQHIASSLGAIGSSWILTAQPDGALLHMNRVALVAFVAAAVVPFLSVRLERLLRERDRLILDVA